MKVSIWIVNTHLPEPGAGPCRPAPFGTEAEAEAYAETALHAEWEAIGPYNDDEPKPYPGNWRFADNRLAQFAEDMGEPYGRWELTSHEVTIPYQTSALPMSLREALKPFLDFASQPGFDKFPDEFPITRTAAKQLTAGDFRHLLTVARLLTVALPAQAGL